MGVVTGTGSWIADDTDHGMLASWARGLWGRSEGMATCEHIG